LSGWDIGLRPKEPAEYAGKHTQTSSYLRRSGLRVFNSIRELERNKDPVNPVNPVKKRRVAP
jgi:hypothetical protein